MALIATSAWVYNTPSQMNVVKAKWKALTEWWTENLGNGDNGEPGMIYTEGEGLNTPLPEAGANPPR